MKKTMAKILAVLASVMLALSFAACGNNTDKTKVKVYMPDGAPAIALAAFMANNYDNTDFTIVNANTIAAHVAGKTADADLAIMPINAAATLYNKGNDIVMLTVNTHGNLFIVGDGGNITLSSLVGKRLGVIGMGNVPDQVLRMLLDRSSIKYEVSDTAVDGKVALRYADDGGTLLPLLKQGVVDYALLPEPAATTAVWNLNKSIVLDIQSAWNTKFGFEYPQACLVARGEFVDNNKAYVDKFINDLKAYDGWAENNPDKAFAALESHMEDGVTSSFKTLNKGMVERCNIRTDYADDAKIYCEQYFVLLTTFETGTGTTALDKIPSDGFYYGKKIRPPILNSELTSITH